MAQNTVMTMFEYRVTERKAREYLGETLLGQLHPFQSKRFMLGFYGLLGGIVFGIIVSILKPRHGVGFLIIGGSLLMEILFYFLIQLTFRTEVPKHLPGLVNDPELLWLNFAQKKEKINYESTEKFKWKRDDHSAFSQTNFKVLAHLKNEGSQGLHKNIPAFKNSNSAAVHLKRLAERGIIEKKENDYVYLPWKFVLVDEQNKSIDTDEARRIGAVLDEGWKRMVGEGNR